MSAEIPRPRAALDRQMVHICEMSAATMENAVTAVLDQHTRDLTMDALGLLNDALQKVRLARRLLTPESEESNT